VGGGSTVAERSRQTRLIATRGERVVGTTMAVLAALGFLALHSGSPLLAVLGVALATVLAAGSIRAHRGVMAIGAFITGFGPWSFAFIFGAPFLALSAFLLWRANRLDNTV
jgi:hypothetical protein